MPGTWSNCSRVAVLGSSIVPLEGATGAAVSGAEVTAPVVSAARSAPPDPSAQAASRSARTTGRIDVCTVFSLGGLLGIYLDLPRRLQGIGRRRRRERIPDRCLHLHHLGDLYGFPAHPPEDQVLTPAHPARP